MNLYVGNLSFDATEDDLNQAFGQFGMVSTVKIIVDRETGRSRGIAFVEMPNGDEARAAIEGLNLQQIAGRAINVDEARPKARRSRTVLNGLAKQSDAIKPHPPLACTPAGCHGRRGDPFFGLPCCRALIVAGRLDGLALSLPVDRWLVGHRFGNHGGVSSSIVTSLFRNTSMDTCILGRIGTAPHRVHR